MSGLIPPSLGSSVPRQVAGGSLGATPSLAMLATDSAVWESGTLTANAAFTITGLLAGQTVRLTVTQNATGYFTLTLTVGADTSSVPVNPAPLSTTVVDVTYDGTTTVVTV